MKLQGAWAAALAGIFAVFHGLAHGYELADSVHVFEALAGMVSATVLLQTAGMGMGWMLRRTNAWVPRLIGATVAVLGSALLLPLA
jgi:urease accessory protein